MVRLFHRACAAVDAIFPKTDNFYRWYRRSDLPALHTEHLLYNTSRLLEIQSWTKWIGFRKHPVPEARPWWDRASERLLQQALFLLSRRFWWELTAYQRNSNQPSMRSLHWRSPNVVLLSFPVQNVWQNYKVPAYYSCSANDRIWIHLPQQFLYFFPLLHGQGSFLPILITCLVRYFVNAK